MFGRISHQEVLKCSERWGTCVMKFLTTFPHHRTKMFGGNVIMMPVKGSRTYLSSEEVAQLLGFSVRTVTLWFNQWHETGGQQGIPGGFKVGKSWRAERREIEAWIEKQKVKPVQAEVVPLRQVQQTR